MSSTSFEHKAGFEEFRGITCTRCGGHVKNYDPGSQAYQTHYGHPLPAICEECLDKIFMNVRRHGRRA